MRRTAVLVIGVVVALLVLYANVPAGGPIGFPHQLRGLAPSVVCGGTPKVYSTAVNASNTSATPSSFNLSLSVILGDALALSVYITDANSVSR